MHVTVLSTGGTIASTDADDGAEPTKSGRELVAAVPALENYADVAVEQVAQVPSFEIDAATLETIGERVSEFDDDPETDAVVITHGTDTIEETAYYLDVAVSPSTPVFLTGAQRRPDETSPDGPRNLLTAFEAATVFRAIDGSGVFVAFNEEIHAARSVMKTHTSKVETFSSIGEGPVATVDPNGVNVHRSPRSETDPLPGKSLCAAVYAVKSGSGVSGTLVDCAIDRSADGIVVEGTGLGNVTADVGEAIERARDADIPVVVTSRCLRGRTAPVYGGTGGGERLREYGAAFAGDLPAQKARLRLQLAIDAYTDERRIRSAFAR